MQPKFNIDRPKVSDDEINKHKDFDKLVKQFKEQSIKKAREDRSWWKNKSIKYAAVISGITVVCTVTYLALFNKSKSTSNDKIITQNTIVNKKEEGPKQAKSFIQPPIKNATVSYNSYKVNNNKGGEIAHPSGSKIKIPKNSLINKQGDLINGEVEIFYREFHDQADIIASGIPMTYDSAGVKYTFESAGMFDIKVLQNGEPVFIKQDAPVTVEFKSKQTADRFNQYYLDTIAKNWQYLNRDNPVKDDNSVAKTDVQQALKKAEQKYEPLIKAIPKRIDSVKVVYTRRIEKLTLPSEPLKPNKSAGRPQFNLDVDYKEFPELSAFKGAVFEIGAENRNFSQELSKITWSSADISEGPKKGINYLLTLKLRDRTENLIVYPVLNGADFAEASKKYEEKFEKYKILQTKREADEKKLKEEMEAKQAAYLAEQNRLKDEYVKEQNRIKLQQSIQLNNQLASGALNGMTVTRVFRLSNFGIFNSDCPTNIPKGQSIKPVFVINDQSKPLRPDILYLIENDRNVVYSYSPADLSKMQIDPSVAYNACLIQGNDVFTISKDEFQQVVSEKGNKFTVQKVTNRVNTIFDFKKVLEL
jgi:hypothetical protein